VLSAESQPGQEGPASRGVLPGEIGNEPAAPADHLQQASPGMLVVLVHLEVPGEVSDAPCQNSDLYLGGTGVSGVSAVFLYDCLPISSVQA